MSNRGPSSSGVRKWFSVTSLVSVDPGVEIVSIPVPGNFRQLTKNPLVRQADYTAMWKVIHWKSVNTTAFIVTDL
jgi:hypothetical protein